MTIRERNKWSDGFKLRIKTQEEWVEDIKKVPQHARAMTARMIWWDYWGERTVAERWTGFDEFLAPPFDEPDAKSLINGLMICGYTEERANSRVRRAA